MEKPGEHISLGSHSEPQNSRISLTPNQAAHRPTWSCLKVSASNPSLESLLLVPYPILNLGQRSTFSMLLSLSFPQNWVLPRVHSLQKTAANDSPLVQRTTLSLENSPEKASTSAQAACQVCISWYFCYFTCTFETLHIWPSNQSSDKSDISLKGRDYNSEPLWLLSLD